MLRGSEPSRHTPTSGVSSARLVQIGYKAYDESTICFIGDVCFIRSSNFKFEEAQRRVRVCLSSQIAPPYSPI